MYFFLLLVCGGIAFFANSLPSDPTLLGDNLPLSLSPASQNELGSKVLLDGDTFSNSNLIGGGNHARSSIID